MGTNFLLRALHTFRAEMRTYPRIFVFFVNNKIYCKILKICYKKFSYFRKAVFLFKVFSNFLKYFSPDFSRSACPAQLLHIYLTLSRISWDLYLTLSRISWDLYLTLSRISWDLECPQTQSLGSEPVSALLPVPGTSQPYVVFLNFSNNSNTPGRYIQ